MWHYNVNEKNFPSWYEKDYIPKICIENGQFIAKQSSKKTNPHKRMTTSSEENGIN